jgi:hypothetical protein
MSKEAKEGLEVARSPSAGGLSMNGSKREIKTLATFEDAGHDEMGQEATLVETEVSPPKSTLGSVFVKLRRKKSKKKHTNIILPPQINQAVAAQDDGRRQEANQKADYARRLFDAAFRPDDLGRNTKDPAEFNGMKKDDMIHTAFKYAVEARRLNSSTLVSKVATEERECVLEEHRAQGETSALDARRFINAIKSRALLANVDVGDEDDGSINGGLFTPQDIQDAAEKNIDVARSHLEYILSTFEKKIKAPEHIILNASPEKGAEDRTLSTLGFDNTFAQEASTSRKEMLSLTSLNEIMDEATSKKSALVGDHIEDPQAVSPLSGTVYSDVDFAKIRRSSLLRRKSKEGQDKVKIKRGTILLPPSCKNNEVKNRSVVRQLVTDMDDKDDISEISGDLESIRQLETAIDRKLKKAAVEDDGEFSLVGEDALILPPCMVSVPSFDPSIMSLENWDNLFDGSSLNDVIARSLQPRECTENEAPKENETNTKHKKKGNMIESWKRRKDHIAMKKEGTKKQEEERPTAFVPIESSGPPSTDVNIRDDPVDVMTILSLDDTLGPCYDLSPIKFMPISSKAHHSDEKERTGEGASLLDESTVQKRRMMSWRRRSSTKGRGAIKQTESDENGDGKLVTGVPKGVTTSTDDIVERSSSEDNGERFKISVEINDSVQKNVRKALSADGGNADGEVANKVEFAQVEIGEDNAVRTEKSLVSRDAVIRNIYAKRTPIVSPHPMERSITANGARDQNVEASSSFLDMIEKVKTQAVTSRKEGERPRDQEKRRFSGIFGRKKQKSQAPQTVYLQPPNFEQGA